MDTEKKSVKKNIIIIIASIAVIIIAVVAGCLFYFKDKTYRVLKVYQIEGQASVIHSDGSEVTPYENMLLQSGDEISLAEGTFVIKADEDKFIYLENNTRIILEADGTAENSRTSIQLLEGAVINQINEPLSDKSVYELNTQNATMSVRGTVYRAEYYAETPTGKDSVSGNTLSGNTVSGNTNLVTDVYDLEGAVETDLVLNNGESGNNKKTITQGKMVSIGSDQNKTEYRGEPQDFDYGEFGRQTLDYLGMVQENGEQNIGVGEEELEELKETAGPFRVTFKNGDEVFGTVSVNKGDFVQEPMLMPTASGNWAFQFDTPITEETEIQWQAGH